MGLGDVLNESSLSGTSFDIAADKALQADPQDISESQTKARRQMVDYINGSDLAAANPEVAQKIVDSIFMIPMKRAENGRRAVTTTGTTVGQDGIARKNLIGVYLTNDADEVSAWDEIFHVVNDSRPNTDQQTLVEAYNQLYGTGLRDYNKNIGTRDRLASRAASILSGKDSLPEGADPNNEFVRVVEAMQNGQILDINPDLIVPESVEDAGVQGLPITPQQIVQEISDGNLFRVTLPGAEDTTVFQDTAGNVYAYQAINDSDGNDNGRFIILGQNEPLPRLDAANGAALVPYQAPVDFGIRAKKELIDLKLEEMERFREMRENGASEEEIDFFLDKMRQRQQARISGSGATAFEREGGTDPTGRDEAAARVQEEIELTRLERELGRKPIALLPPAIPKTPLNTNIGLMETLAAGVPEADVDYNPNFTADPGSVLATFDPETQQQLLADGQETVADRRQSRANLQREINSLVDQAALDLAQRGPNNALRRLVEVVGPERARRMVSQAAGQDLRPVAPAGTPAPAAPQGLLPQNASQTGPVSNLPGIPLPQQTVSSQQAAANQEAAALSNIEADQAAQEQARRQPPSEQEIAEAIAAIDAQQSVEASQTGSTSPAAEVQVEPQSKAEASNERYPGLDPALNPIADALLQDQETEGLSNIGVADADTGNPIFEVTSEVSQELRSAGIATGARADLGSEGESIVTELLPQFITRDVTYGQDENVQEQTPAATVVDPVAVEDTFFEVATPKKGVGSKGGRLTSVELLDENGDVIDTFPSAIAAKNWIQNEFTPNNTEERPGSGNQDIIDIGGREFIISPVSQDLNATLTEEYGPERVAQIGTLMQSLDDGSKDRLQMQKAINRATRRVIWKATGNPKFDQGKMDEAFADLDQVIEDTFESTGTTRVTAEATTNESQTGQTEEPVQTEQGSQEIIKDSSEISVTLTDAQTKELNLALEDGRFENSLELAKQIESNNGSKITLTGDAVNQLNEFAKFQSSLVEEEDKELRKRGKLYQRIADKTTSVIEPDLTIEPTIPALGDKTVKGKLKNMRKMVKQGRLTQHEGGNTIVYRTRRKDSAAKFNDAVGVIGGVVSNQFTDGKETVVEAKVAPGVLSEIFKNQISAETTLYPGTPFSSLTSEGEPISNQGGSYTANVTFGPNTSEAVRSLSRGIMNTVKLRAPIHVVEWKDLDAPISLIEGSSNKYIRSRLEGTRDFIEKYKANGALTTYKLQDGTQAFVLGLGPNFNIGTAKGVETIAHEFGHAIHREVLDRSEHDDARTKLMEEHQGFIEDYQSRTVADFMRASRNPATAAASLQRLGDTAESYTLAEVRNHADPDVRSMYQYMTSFNEFIADQTARWILSDRPSLIAETNSLKKFWSAVSKRLNRVYKYIKDNTGVFDEGPETSFNEWIEGWATSPTVSKLENFFDYQQSNDSFTDGLKSIPDIITDRSFETDDSVTNLKTVDPYMSTVEIAHRLANVHERGLNGRLTELRDKITNWSELEDAINQGIPMDAIYTGEALTEAELYAEIYQDAIETLNRPAPEGDVPLDVMASYSTAPTAFPDALRDRAEALWNSWKESSVNALRRRVFSPIITRAQIAADNHPDIPVLGRIIDLTIGSPSRASNVDPYVDKIRQEITLRTGRVTQVLDPLFKAYGYTGTTAQRVVAVGRKGSQIGDMLHKVTIGIRDKDVLTAAELAEKFNGVSLETMIDQMRDELDDLRNWAVSKGILNPADFIVVKDGDREHYVPRVYDRDVIIENFDAFRDDVVAKNLERVYRKSRVEEIFAADNGREMTEAESDAITEAELAAVKLDKEDMLNISKISSQVAANIGYGRTAQMSDQFNDKFSWLSHKSLDDIIDEVGRNVPPRLKKRRLHFIPDLQLFGQKPAPGGTQINFMNTNIMDVMGQTIEQIIKRGTYSELYANGNVFRDAQTKLEEKLQRAREKNNKVLVNQIKRDIHTIRGLYESIAEVVDLNADSGLQDTPIRSAIASFSRVSTMSVMGLSSVLGIVETGNIPLRTGIENGIPALWKGVEITAKKAFKWPGVLFGGANYTDRLEDEATALGILHRVGEDFSSRNRLDPFQESVGGGSGGLGNNNKNVSPLRRRLRNLSSTTEFLEDAFYRVTMLDQITRISQITAVHAGRNMMRSIVKAFKAGEMNNARKRELIRLGFATSDGKFDYKAFTEYINFFDGLELARAKGSEEIKKYGEANRDMFFDTHHRVTTRLMNQMITRPNQVTRTLWGNSQNPLMRAMYRLRSFTHGYREMAGRFFADEARASFEDQGTWGLAKFMTRLLPLIMLSMFGMIMRSELQAYLHEATGNSSQAERIRTRFAEQSSSAFMIEAVDKSGLLFQSSEIIGGVEGLRYGNSIFSVIGGVNASKVERTFDAAMKSGSSGDPSFLVNNIIDFAPGSNTGAWDWMHMSQQSRKTKSDMDHIGAIGGSQATWW